MQTHRLCQGRRFYLILTCVIIMCTGMWLFISITDASGQQPSVSPTPINVLTISTPTPQLSLTQNGSPLPTLTSNSAISPPDQQTASYMFSIYEDLIETSKLAILAARDTLNHVMTIATIIVAIVLSGGLFSIYRLESNLKKLKSSEEKISAAETRIDGMNRQISDHESKLEARIAEWENKFEILESSIRDRFLKLQEATVSTTSNEDPLGLLYAQLSVKRYAIRLFSEQESERIKVQKELIALSNNDEPLVRIECLQLFAKLPDYSDELWREPSIHNQIRVLMNDTVGAVRKEADIANRIWEEKLRQRGQTLSSQELDKLGS